MKHSDDKLFCMFTAWLKVIIKHAKIDYIRRQKYRVAEVSIEDKIMDDNLVYVPTIDNISLNEEFTFENQEVEMAFKSLSAPRKEILELIFLRNMTPEDIANELGCSVSYVYNIKSKAIKDLKIKLKRD